MIPVTGSGAALSLRPVSALRVSAQGFWSGVVYGSRTRVAGVKARHPWPARRTRQVPLSAVSKREGSACRPGALAAHGARPRAHPRTAVPSARAWRVVQGHTRKWSGRRGSNPWPRPWRGRALPIELHPQFLRDSRPASTGAASRQVVNERRHACSVAARWPQPRRAMKSEDQNKKARIHQESGPLVERSGGTLYTSCCPGCLWGSR